MDHDPPILFAVGATRAFGERVAATLGTPLSPHEERVFEDGEQKTRPLESVRERDVYVIHSLCSDSAESANDKLVKLLLFIGALKDASAARVTAVVPYLAYARKDRRSKARDPVATRYVAQMFEAVGADCVVTIDVHNVSAFQNAFRCRTENLEAAPLFVRHFTRERDQGPYAVVSPDAGGIKRADAFRARMEAALGELVPMGFAEKHRSAGMVTGTAFVGDVAGRIAIIVDDLISSGTTMLRTAGMCRDRGARGVFAVASHAVFGRGANEALASEAFDRIVVTDTVAGDRLVAPAAVAKLERISAAELFAQAIRRLHEGGSLVELMQQHVPDAARRI